MPQLPLPTPSSTTPSATTEGLQYRSYKLVGDNIDKSVKVRYMHMEGRRNQSLHYFNSFALRDRISFNHLPDVFPHTCFNSPKQRALVHAPIKKG